MRLLWRLCLCLWGVTLFAVLTYASLTVNGFKESGNHHRYFWWGSVRLDSDPLNKHQVSKPCMGASDGGCDFDPEHIWVSPGWIEIALTLSALPAFILAIASMHGLARLGVSELLSFMFAMLLFTVAWFYGVGWLLDRWRYKRSLNRAISGQQVS